MGNPAGMRRIKKEKRRAKFEKRLGALAYVPKELQADVSKAVAELQAEEKATKAAHAKAKAEQKKS